METPSDASIGALDPKRVNPETITLEKDFTRDVRKTGHFGTGDLEIRIDSDEDLKKAESLLVKSYEAS